MKKAYTCLLLTAAVAMAGCDTAPKQPETKYVLVTTPASLTKPCPIIPPPNKEKYMAATPEERADMLWQMNIDQMKNIATCNARLKQVPEWTKKQEEIYGKKPP